MFLELENNKGEPIITRNCKKRKENVVFINGEGNFNYHTPCREIIVRH